MVIKKIFLFFLIFTFFLGLAFYLSPYPVLFLGSSEPSGKKESMASLPGNTPPNPNCPNILIQKGNSLLLYNSLLPESDTNPIHFSNLDEYITYVENRRNEGIRCPVLFLQQENNIQGQDVYRIRPSPFSLEGGLPPMIPNPVRAKDASRENPPYNANNYAGFDPYGLYVGEYTDIDKIHDSTEQAPVSDNPMDPNWGGVMHSQSMIDSGKYDENTVGKPTMVPSVLALR
jgi:hypothetical protein